METGIDRPESGVRFWRLRQKCWDQAEDTRLEIVWAIAIVVNIALLMLDHYPAADAWVYFIETANMLCLLAFTAELIMKVGGYTFWGCLRNGWMRLDLIVVCGSWCSKLFGVKAGMGAIRAFRTVRLVLLVKRMPGLMALMNTVLVCIGPAANIAAMSFLFFYLYAIVGMKLFGDAPTDMRYYDEQNNFSSFFHTLRLLFQLINGQDVKSNRQRPELRWLRPSCTILLRCFILLLNSLHLRKPLHRDSAG